MAHGAQHSFISTPVALFICSALILAQASVTALSEEDDDSVPKTEKSGSLEQPTITGPLKANPKPASFEAGLFGTINVSGVISGYGLKQDHPTDTDKANRLDFTNLQLILQKADGPIQFYVQTGLYSIPAVGITNTNAIYTTNHDFGYVPVVYGKIKLNDEISVQGGKMPSLINGDRTFTFQNANIEQGLLFNQTNNINKGVQIAYSTGPIVASASLNDGFYSDRVTWMIGSLVYKIDDANRINFSAGANLDRTTRDSFATPLLQDNSSIYNLSYGYKAGPWIIAPSFQYTHVPRDVLLGITESASTYGGALVGNYALTDHLSMAGRFEYIAQTGSRSTGSTNLLYGPGSRALSISLTPTWQIERYFIRGEYSYVRALNATSGLTFGRTGTKITQNRFVVETGILF